MSNQPSNEQIEARAYELYLERGRQDGHDMEDWLTAERELAQRQREVRAVFEQEEPESRKLGYAATASNRRK
jgi:hypothetical protein